MSNGKKIIYIGFSFSLNKDSSFGDYNKDIAQSIIDSFNKDKENNVQPWIGVQWELYDALLEADKDFIEYLPISHIAAPPLFNENDFKGNNGNNPVKNISNALIDTEKLPSPKKIVMDILNKIIIQRFHEMPPININKEISYPDQLAAILNSVITQKEFLNEVINAEKAEKIKPELSFDEQKRDGWIEERKLPSSVQGLGFFQSRRLSRIIMDWLFKDEIVSAKYLNTFQVCKMLFDRVDAEGIEIDHIKVFGFPEHSPRCTATVLQSIWARGIVAKFDNIINDERVSLIDVNNPDGKIGVLGEDPTYLNRACALEKFEWRWYKDTAQNWCSSLPQWKKHEGL